MASGERHSVAETPELITDEVEKAKREAENGIRQFRVALEMIRGHVHDAERPFRLRQSMILELHETALRGIHPLAGTFRNTSVSIGQSKHTPPHALHVSDEVADMCTYVNQKWSTASAVHLAAYVLWKLNWIHPFADGNGRTSRAISYVVMSVKLDSLLPGTPTIPDQIASDQGTLLRRAGGGRPPLGRQWRGRVSPREHDRRHARQAIAKRRDRSRGWEAVRTVRVVTLLSRGKAPAA